jgi:hypothetical protein
MGSLILGGILSGFGLGGVEGELIAASAFEHLLMAFALSMRRDRIYLFT